ncbi:hypothetical protein ARALYDRAFT_895220 [Arabidopsis lyrata subsp. lyrata]|uniref:MATH domain-containing protein n=1 Tax=Arabidopsis lyrata subsp. lyrata TaxID=81972 RepID=D7KRK0_ARALL|nr:hypothetical protein ARALYDRAFT_895220 [Arabidopsis lyrata subsp. lyrata]
MYHRIFNHKLQKNFVLRLILRFGQIPAVTYRRALNRRLGGRGGRVFEQGLKLEKENFSEEKNKNRNYGSIFVYCFFCFVLVVEVARFAKPYYNLQNLMETEAIVEEGFLDVENSGRLPCHSSGSGSVSVPARSHQKLSDTIRQESRARPPTSYCVKIQSFATLSKLVKDNGDMYESRPFSVGGYNWTFLIYPNENKPQGSGGYVSLYVRIDNSSLIANPEDVYAEITFLVYKSTIDKYHILKETKAQRFHLFRQQWGQLNFLEIGYFLNPVHGFIFNGGQSVFGVDIFVAKPFENWEVFSYEKNIRDPIFDWRLNNFSTLDRDSYTSGSFSSGGRKLVTSLSLSLHSRSNHVEKQVRGWPNATENGWGFEKFIPLADIKDTSKGFLVNDSLKLQIEILSFSKTDSL